ncbi:MAG: P-loop NTPase [Nitrososphaerales archaeon]
MKKRVRKEGRSERSLKFGRKKVSYMLDKDAIIDRLKRVIDPEIGINIVDLNMVKSVEIDKNKVDVTIALTVPNCPLANTIKSDVERALMSVKGVQAFDVRVTSMTKEELDALAKSIQQKRVRRISPMIEKLEKGSIRNVIAIVSGKGGVGKSFVTGMLAIELRRQGHEVGILDADITGSSIPKIFGLNERPTKGELGINPVLTRLGIKVMSMNLILDDPTTPIIWRGPLISSAIRQLYQDVDWGELHYLLLDLPPGCLTGDTLVYTNPHPKPISQIKPGDLVYSFEGRLYKERKWNLDAELVKRKVLGVIPQGMAGVWELRTNGRTIRGTADHPILALRKTLQKNRFYTYALEWRHLAQLRPGDVVLVVKKPPLSGKYGARPIRGRTGVGLLNAHVGFERVKSVAFLGKSEVYDLEVEGNHNFVADGMIVHNTSDVPLTVFQSLPLDGIIVASSPQDLAVIVVKKAMNMAKHMNIPILGLIENMSYIECPKCGEKIELYGPSKGFEVAKDAGIQFLGKIPVDPMISTLSDQGRLEDYSNSAFTEITRALRLSLEKVVKETSARQPIAWSKQ